MVMNVMTVGPEASVRQAADMLFKNRISALPVVDEQQKLRGIVSLGDLARETDGEGAHEALEGVSQPGGQHQQ